MIFGTSHVIEIVSIIDCVAFTGAINKEVIVYVHYCFEENAYSYTSYLRRFSTTDHEDVQGGHDLVKNILEYKLTTRHIKIKKALVQLLPVPDQWKHTRPGSIVSTPATSFMERQGSTRVLETCKGNMTCVFL